MERLTTRREDGRIETRGISYSALHMDLEGQALLCSVIILLVASVINQVIKLCG